MDILQPNPPETLRRRRVAPVAFGLLAAWLITVLPGQAGKARASTAHPAVLILDQSSGLAAVDAMSTDSTKGNELLIRSTLEEDDVIVIVEDSGVGTAAEELDKIFNAFVTTKIDGMGLGLSICRSIVESHGGRISLAPATSRGKVFTVSLPQEDQSK